MQQYITVDSNCQIVIEKGRKPGALTPKRGLRYTHSAQGAQVLEVGEFDERQDLE